MALSDGLELGDEVLLQPNAFETVEPDLAEGLYALDVVSSDGDELQAGEADA